MKRVAVIGAGPAGLTAALKLAERGVGVEVFEAGGQVGGMARSFPLWDAIVDVGPHRFFSRDVRVDSLWHELAGTDFRTVERLTRIYYRGRFFSYPLRPANALINLGPREACRCLASYAAQLLRRPPRGEVPESFEDWVVAAFGRRLFEVFFKDYSEKLWGIPCSELDVDFAAQRIQRFSLGSAILSALGLERRVHKTLVHRFSHPIRGAGMIYERMAQRIKALGGAIHLNHPAAGLADARGGVRFPDGSVRSFDHVVSTMPLDLLAASLPDLPDAARAACGGLEFRNTILVYLRVDAPDLFPDQWIYMQSPEFRFGRVTNFRNWPSGVPARGDHSILALEYWCQASDALWGADDAELIRLATTEIAASGLTRGAAVADGRVLRVPRCYPVYRKGYRALLAPVVEHLRRHYPRLSPIGRYGAFKYNNQDHSILMGILAAENIADGAVHDLWAVNTDYGSYQES